MVFEERFLYSESQIYFMAFFTHCKIFPLFFVFCVSSYKRERLKQKRIAAREQRVEHVREVQQQADNLPDAVLEPQENERETVFEDEDSEQEETFEMSM